MSDESETQSQDGGCDEDDLPMFLSDQLTLLACARQGISVRELLPIESVSPRPLEASHAALRAEVFESRRQAKLRMLRSERGHLVGRIARGGDAPLMSELLLQCASAVRADPVLLSAADVDGWCPFLDFNEEAAAKQLVNDAIRAKQQKISNVASSLGSVDVAKYTTDAEKFQELERRKADKEFHFVEMSNLLHASSKRRERRREKIEAVRKRELHVLSVMRGDRRAAKLEQMQRHRAAAEASEGDRAAARTAAHDERERQKERHRARFARERADASEERVLLFQHRQAAFVEATDLTGKLERDTLTRRLAVCEARVTNRRLHNACQKEETRYEKTCRAINRRMTLAAMAEADSLKASDVLRKEEEAEVLLGRQRAKVRRAAARSKRAGSAAQDTASRNRRLLSLDRERRANCILRGLLLKEARTVDLAQRLELRNALRVETSLHTELVVTENRQRLDNIREHRHALAAVKVSEDEHRETTRKRHLAEFEAVRAQQLLAARLEKERVKAELHSRARLPLSASFTTPLAAVVPRASFATRRPSTAAAPTRAGSPFTTQQLTPAQQDPPEQPAEASHRSNSNSNSSNSNGNGSSNSSSNNSSTSNDKSASRGGGNKGAALSAGGGRGTVAALGPGKRAASALLRKKQDPGLPREADNASLAGTSPVDEVLGALSFVA
ncbi:hypothetical protein DIPPA_24762 [Diplonema papillatum]|nr:hypothetical protein DIPPA_24762 [Diplonema papillatum]